MMRRVAVADATRALWCRRTGTSEIRVDARWSDTTSDEKKQLNADARKDLEEQEAPGIDALVITSSDNGSCCTPVFSENARAWRGHPRTHPSRHIFEPGVSRIHVF
eukprot:3930449-Prymnesium_polylepis.1